MTEGNSGVTEKGERCRQHYQSVYERNQPELSKGRALDECLHHFLDQRPAGKNLSAIDRVIVRKAWLRQRAGLMLRQWPVLSWPA